jgi:hypothetical protein
LNRDITRNEGEDDEDDARSQKELRINIEIPSKLEILQAINSLKNGKAPGVDRIPPKVLKDITTELLYPIIKKIWI